MVVRMRHTRAHTANRRSHHALKNMRISVSKEGAAHPRHRALLDGSQYRGRSVMDKTAARAARARKSATRREQEDGPKPANEAMAEEVKVAKAEAKATAKKETKKLPKKSKEAK